MLVGEAQPSEELDRLCALEGVELRPGFLPDEEVDFWASAADVVVMPYDRGSHSGVLHRALAVATPVLGSPALAEEVERTGAGRVVVLEPDAWSRPCWKRWGPIRCPRQCSRVPDRQRSKPLPFIVTCSHEGLIGPAPLGRAEGDRRRCRRTPRAARYEYCRRIKETAW